MVSRLPDIDADGEVGDLSTVDPALFRPFSELPASLQARLKTLATQPRVSVSLSADVVERFRATGADWQARIDAVLKDWLSEHPQP